MERRINACRVVKGLRKCVIFETREIRPNNDNLRDGEKRKAVKISFLPMIYQSCKSCLVKISYSETSLSHRASALRQMSFREGDWSLFLDPDQATNTISPSSIS